MNKTILDINGTLIPTSKIITLRERKESFYVYTSPQTPRRSEVGILESFIGYFTNKDYYPKLKNDHNWSEITVNVIDLEIEGRDEPLELYDDDKAFNLVDRTMEYLEFIDLLDCDNALYDIYWDLSLRFYNKTYLETTTLENIKQEFMYENERSA